jgi:hypothetical protein
LSRTIKKNEEKIELESGKEGEMTIEGNMEGN